MVKLYKVFQLFDTHYTSEELLDFEDKNIKLKTIAMAIADQYKKENVLDMIRLYNHPSYIRDSEGQTLLYHILMKRKDSPELKQMIEDTIHSDQFLIKGRKISEIFIEQCCERCDLLEICKLFTVEPTLEFLELIIKFCNNRSDLIQLIKHFDLNLIKIESPYLILEFCKNRSDLLILLDLFGFNAETVVDSKTLAMITIEYCHSRFDLADILTKYKHDPKIHDNNNLKVIHYLAKYCSGRTDLLEIVDDWVYDDILR